MQGCRSQVRQGERKLRTWFRDHEPRPFTSGESWGFRRESGLKKRIRARYTVRYVGGLGRVGGRRLCRLCLGVGRRALLPAETTGFKRQYRLLVWVVRGYRVPPRICLPDVSGGGGCPKQHRHRECQLQRSLRGWTPSGCLEGMPS